MGILASEAATAGTGSMIGVILMYVVIFGVFFYFCNVPSSEEGTEEDEYHAFFS